MIRNLLLALSIKALVPYLGVAQTTQAIEIRLHSGTALEERGREQLHRILATYNLDKWIFTHEVMIQSRVIPHSHPLLTLNTRYLEDDIAQLGTFLHEQLHWFLTDHVAKEVVGATIEDLRQRYRNVPTEPPEGAMGEHSTYLHLIVCHLELQALTQLVGEGQARKQLESWDHYTWVYHTVLKDVKTIGRVVNRHGVRLPNR